MMKFIYLLICHLYMVHGNFLAFKYPLALHRGFHTAETIFQEPGTFVEFTPQELGLIVVLQQFQNRCLVPTPDWVLFV